MRAFALCLLILACASGARAQPSNGLPLPSTGHHLAVSLQQPFYETGDDLTFFALSLIADYESPQMGPVRFQTAVPVSFVYSSFRDESDAEFALGNLYAGIVSPEVAIGPVQVEMGGGVWVPTSDLNERFGAVTALLRGVQSEPGRPGAFWPGAITPAAFVQGEVRGPEGIVGRVRLAPQALIIRSEAGQLEDGDDVEPVLGYLVQGEILVGSARLAVSLSGSEFLADEDDRFDVVYMGVGVEVPVGSVRLGGHVRAALAEGPNPILALGLTTNL